MKTKTTTLYWLRLAEHTDIFTEGYVGVSTDPKTRIANHLTGNANSTVLSRNGIDRDDVIVEQWEIPYDTHRFMEAGLRPTYNCGWNVLPGGQGQGRPIDKYKGVPRPNRGGATVISQTKKAS